MGHGRERRRAQLIAAPEGRRAAAARRKRSLRRPAAGVTLVEFVVVIVCVVILCGFLLDRVVPLIGLAEKTAFEQVRSQLQSALLLEAAERVARGESASLAALDGANPMDLLLEPPAAYLGALDAPAAFGRNSGRVWYFDARDRTLVYRVGAGTSVTVSGMPTRTIRLAVRFVFRDRDGDGDFDPTADHFDGLRLEPVENYRWGVGNRSRRDG